MSGPPVIESRIERAPSTEVSSNGEDTVVGGGDPARVAGAHADAEEGLARVAHRRADVGEVEVDSPAE